MFQRLNTVNNFSTDFIELQVRQLTKAVQKLQDYYNNALCRLKFLHIEERHLKVEVFKHYGNNNMKQFLIIVLKLIHNIYIHNMNKYSN